MAREKRWVTFAGLLGHSGPRRPGSFLWDSFGILVAAPVAILSLPCFLMSRDTWMTQRDHRQQHQASQITHVLGGSPCRWQNRDHGCCAGAQLSHSYWATWYKRRREDTIRPACCLIETETARIVPSLEYDWRIKGEKTENAPKLGSIFGGAPLPQNKEMSLVWPK